MNEVFETSCMEVTLHKDKSEIIEEAEISGFELFKYLPFQKTSLSPKEVAEDERHRQDDLREDRWEALAVTVRDWFNQASSDPVEPFQIPNGIWKALTGRDPDYEPPICRDELAWIGYEASRVLKEFTLENGYPDHLICLMMKAVWGLIQKKDGARRELAFHEPCDFKEEEPEFDAYKIRVIENRISLAYTESCIRLREMTEMPSRRAGFAAKPALQIYEP